MGGNDGLAACAHREEVWRRESRHAGSVVVHDVGRTELALQAFDIKDLTVDGGEETVFRELDERFPDNVAADRLGEAMDEALGLKIVKNKTSEAFTVIRWLPACSWSHGTSAVSEPEERLKMGAEDAQEVMVEMDGRGVRNSSHNRRCGTNRGG